MTLNFEARREKHAIQQFTATVNFHAAVSQSTFSEIASVLKTIAGEDQLNLPAPLNVKAVTFRIGQSPEVIESSSSSFEVGGLGFQRFASDGEVEASLFCAPNSIKLTLRDYTVWEEVRLRLAQAFTRLSMIYASEIPAISSVILEYLNEFRATPGGLISAKELFKEQSPWISKIGLDSELFWHSHTGAFFPIDEYSRDLANVNCDVLSNKFDELTTTVVRLLILTGRFYNLPEQPPLTVGQDTIGEVLQEHFETAHSFEKKVLNEVLSDDYLDLIGGRESND